MRSQESQTSHIHPGIDIVDRIGTTELLTSVVNFVETCDVTKCTGKASAFVLQGTATFLKTANRLLGRKKEKQASKIPNYDLCPEISIERPSSAQSRQSMISHVVNGEIKTKKYVIGALLSIMHQAKKAGGEVDSSTLNHLITEAITVIGPQEAGRWRLKTK